MAYTNTSLLKKCDLKIGTFYFYEHYIISEVSEGVTLTYENALHMLELVKTYYGNTTPFVYIANRKNSYSFDPTDHFKTTAQFPNLKGYAVVIYNPINEKVAKMEQSFMNKPANIFRSIEDAVNWVEEVIIMD